VIVKPLPVASLDNLTTEICSDQTVTLTGTMTATGAWTMKFTGGAPDKTGTGSGSFTHTFDHGVTSGTIHYQIASIQDGNCTALSGFTGEAVVTIDQKPILVVHDPAAVCATDPVNNSINLTVAAVTSGSTIPAGTTLTYWKDAAQLTNEQAQNIAIAGSYTIKATNGVCVVTADVNAAVNSPDCTYPGDLYVEYLSETGYLGSGGTDASL